MPKYKKIASANSFLIGSSKLLRGDDCLLLVNTVAFNERYRRLYFRDIQGIQILPGSGRLIYGMISGAVLAVLTLLFGLIAAASRNDDLIFAVFFFGLLAVPILVWFIANLVRGPMCRCEIHTAVQSLRLPMLNRVRQAERFVETLRPTITKAQGSLEADELREQLGAAWEEAARLRRAHSQHRGIRIGRQINTANPKGVTGAAGQIDSSVEQDGQRNDSPGTDDAETEAAANSRSQMETPGGQTQADTEPSLSGDRVNLSGTSDPS